MSKEEINEEINEFQNLVKDFFYEKEYRIGKIVAFLSITLVEIIDENDLSEDFLNKVCYDME